jgi:hypothetical protein
MTDANFPSAIEQGLAAAVHGTAPAHRVGELPRDAAVCADTLEQTICDCMAHLQRALDAFHAHGNPVDRDDAVFWQHRVDEAIQLRDLRRRR